MFFKSVWKLFYWIHWSLVMNTHHWWLYHDSIILIEKRYACRFLFTTYNSVIKSLPHATQSSRQEQPDKIVIAVPIASETAIEILSNRVDENGSSTDTKKILWCRCLLWRFLRSKRWRSNELPRQIKNWDKRDEDRSILGPLFLTDIVYRSAEALISKFQSGSSNAYRSLHPVYKTI